LSVPTLGALAGFLGSVATLLMALAQWVARKTETARSDDGDRL
jgi:cytosine/uracil/thiamine/allantoin permease